MIKEKLEFTKQILTDYPETRGDGNGIFLNKVAEQLCPDGIIDFTVFNMESYTRARRKVLELNSDLDNRTSKSDECENIIRGEMR
tara:strand:+ start:62 stop:316 length:255 start_codon:yes stop_codon:yes gene_type:complete